MFIEELTLIKEVGLGAAGIVALYLLLKMVISWSHTQAEKTLKLAETTSDKILKLADDTISKNTKALQGMQESLIKNMRSKEQLMDTIDEQTTTFIESHNECKKKWDERIQKILDSGKRH